MIDDTRVLSRQLAVSLAGITFLIAIGELVLFTFSGSVPPHYQPLALYFVYLSGFVVTPLLMYFATRSSKLLLVAIIWYHVTTGILIVFFSEIVSPFTALWSMMVLFASLTYGWRGFIASSLSLASLALIYNALYAGEMKDGALVYAVLSCMIVLIVTFTSYLFVRIIMDGRRKNRELEKAEHSEQMQVNRQTTLLNSISDAVMTLNRYGRITSQNAAAQAFFDTNSSLVGQEIDSILKLTDRINQPISAREMIGFVKTTVMRDDLSVGSGEDVRHLSIQMARIRSTFDDEEEYGVVLIIRDITKQKTLEDEKDEFISVTSHELRTPIAIAEGSLSNLLVMYERGAEPEILKGAAKTAYDQIIYLAKIINDLSTLSRAERGVGDETETINANELVHDLYNRYLGEAEAKKLGLDLDAEGDLPDIITSRLYLEEMLQNFITNAIKYTKKGTVTLIAKKQENGVLFAVKDTGIGISKADQPKIFDKFYRSEDYRTRETSGTGLGLYVVQKLALKLGTSITVDSRLNHGSTFSVVVPLRLPRTEPSEPQE